MECLVCNKQISALSSVKMHNGRLCKNCAAQLPSMVIDYAPYLQTDSLKHVMNVAKDNYERFSATASYGELHIDEIGGLFAIAKSLDKDGKPKDSRNVFSIYGMSEVGLYCTSPKADGGNVILDIEFSCKLEEPKLEFKHTVKKAAKCAAKRVDANHVTWEEPNDLAMFRKLFNQMLSGMHENVNRMLHGKTLYQFELEKHRALFMLTEDYDMDDLTAAFHKMMQVWQPDGEGETPESIILKKAYYALIAELEYQERKRGRID
ncbi:MAG: hypothetical protein IJ419_02410 [Agathobacter sp.]|nr:hypothetical protein [Agathobacter sp.]